MKDRWKSGPTTAQDDIDELVFLSHILGEEETLVQPGGGNTSVKVTQTGDDGQQELVLAVKGSGTDLRTIPREGFTRLSMQRLAGLQRRGEMSDEEMMAFMNRCMLAGGGPVPSVETPLHSLLPHRVIAHTHDVATMSLTNIAEQQSREWMQELFDQRLFYVPYVRPGFPLAAQVAQVVDQIPRDAWGLALAHHGLVAWGDNAKECYEHLRSLVGVMEEFFGKKKQGKSVFGSVSVEPSPAASRSELASLLMPVIRGELGQEERVILHFDDSEHVLGAIGREGFGPLSQKGMVTPEHILRAGRMPLWVDVDLGAPPSQLIARTKEKLQGAAKEYRAYHQRHSQAKPIPDWAKVVLIPGLGMVTAFKDKKSAATAALCYHACIDTLENAEAASGFEFISEEDVFEFEHWPLERRKVEESIEKERKSLLLPRRVVLVVGGGSGIGEASAWRFAEEGAHVVVADVTLENAQKVADEIGAKFKTRVSAVSLDVRDDAQIAAAIDHTVLEFGGLDCLFYTAGVPPHFARITELDRANLQKQVDVHYHGAVLTMGAAAKVMERQGLGGSILCSVSKAALAPGKEALAYGGSKAALQQAVRVAALELGSSNIRVNAINADQVDTPLFRAFVAARAESQGKTLEQQLAKYRERNAMGTSLIPARSVAEIAVLLASDRFAYTTGDILTVDGGLPDAFPR